MYNSIEIPDSDDDMPEKASDALKLIMSDSEIKEHTPEKQRKISMSSTGDTILATTPESTSSDTTENCSQPKTANNNTTSSSNHLQAKTQVRHRARKTQHTVRNAPENEIQFETIPLEDEPPTDENKLTDHEQYSSESEGLIMTIENILNTDKFQDIIKRIASERVRSNFLLATYQLPEINFTINTPIEGLKIEFQERLKKRRSRPNVLNETKIAITDHTQISLKKKSEKS